jgi:hypothetical protein
MVLQRTNPGKMKLIRVVTNSSDEKCWVTDDEDERDAETESKGKRSGKEQELTPGWWERILRNLPRLRIRGERQWQIGDRCLVMTGKPGLDEGQVAIVIERKPCMVEIAFRGPDGRSRRKLKRSGSLIGLRPGVSVVQDKDGTVWVQQEQKAKEERE